MVSTASNAFPVTQGCGELASMPQLAVKAVLETVIGFEAKSLPESLADERRAVLATMRSADAREGMMAFIEKRKPVFNQ